MILSFLADTALPTLPSKAAVPAVPKPDFFSNWTWMNWALCIIAVLVVLFVLYLLCMMVVRHIRLRRMVHTMREDLLLRRELADMAGGKDIKAQRQEQYLRTESIRMDVQASVARMRENGVEPRHTGCWLLLGEPGSGKGRLLQYGGIEFPAGINDLADTSEATSTFKLWLCAKGAVWDIGGRMLLNRWGGKQDNEWRVFLEEFRKAYKNGLPDGVVLTIPVDALLHDDSALRSHKISLLAEELRTLVHITGAYCPVWVVVTKCDMVPGFTDFFSLLQEEELRHCLGWANTESDGSYRSESALDSFDTLVTRLRALRDAYAADTDVWEKAASGAERADTMAPVYLMPERFSELKDSLQRYFEGIFTCVQQSEQSEGKLFRFCGCWFTAALDHPVTTTEHILLENTDGKLQPVVVPSTGGMADPTALWHDAGNTTGLVTVREKILSTASERRFFTADLLNKVICGSAAGSRYTRAALRRIRRPYWVATSVLAGLSLPLFGWSVVSHDELNSLATRDIDFWNNTHKLFREGHIAGSPLLGSEKDKQVAMTGKSVPTTDIARREYLYSLSNMALVPVRLPLFWQPAAWAVDYEFNRNLLASSKRFIDKAALVNMLLKPAVVSARKTFSYRADHDTELQSLWSRHDTQALATLLQITRYGIELTDTTKHIKDDIDYTHLVNINGAPAQDSAIKSLWLHGKSLNGDLNIMTPLNGYLSPVSSEAAMAISKAVALYVSKVRPLTVYPEFRYAELHDMIQTLTRMLETQRAMQAEELRLSELTSSQEDEIIACVSNWQHLYEELMKERDELKERIHHLGLENAPSLRAEADAVNTALGSALIEDQNRFNRMAEGLPHSANADFLREQIKVLVEAINGATPHLTGDYSKLTDELCTFWDLPQGETRRPWEKYCEYAERIHAFFNVEFPAGNKSERIGVRIRRVEEFRKKQNMTYEGMKEDFPSLDESCKEMLWDRMLGRVILRWLKEAPHSNLELMESMAHNLPTRHLPAPPFSVGTKVPVRCCYEPENAERALHDSYELVNYVAAFLPQAPSSMAVEIESSMNTLRDAADHYRSDYLLYWMDEVPSYYKLNNIRTWQQFVQSGEAFSAAHSPDSIFMVNRLMLSAISIPALSDEQQYPELAKKRQGITAAQEALTQDVRRKMDTSAEFFSTLDVDPVKAWQTLQVMDSDDYFTSWWGGWYTDKTGACMLIWNDFLTKGMTLLKQETSARLIQNASSCFPLVTMFPLNNTMQRGAGEILSLYDIENIQEKLAGTAPAEDKELRKAEAKKAAALDVPAELAARRLPLRRKREQVWQQVSKVADLLVNPEQPLTCIPVLPAANKRNAAFTGEGAPKRVVPVSRRYPYMRLLCGGRALTSVISLNRINDADIDLTASSLSADLGDLEFEFFRHSTSATADASVKLSGAWSPLNLYLRQGTRLSDDKKTAYIPVIFRDKEGYTCLLWAGLRFNHNMLAADEWPGTAVFDKTQTDPETERKQKEKQLRKALCTAFIGPYSKAVNPDTDARLRLQEELESMQKDGCGICFEIVTPGVVTQSADDVPPALGRFPYFSLGTDLESSGKLRAIPQTTKTASYIADGGEPALLRLFRHAEDEYSTLYAQTEESLLHYVIRHATAYNSTEGYFIVPLRASGNGESVDYTLYLRPVLSRTFDDGLLPENSLFPAEDAPEAEVLTD